MMLDRETCVSCPNRDERAFSTLRTACAALALGSDYIADDCDGGPFPKRRLSICHTAAEALVGGEIVSVEYGCSRDEPRTPMTDVVIAGTETLVTRGGQVLEHTRNGESLL